MTSFALIVKMLFYILLFFYLLPERLTILRLTTPGSYTHKNMQHVGAVHLCHLYIQHTPTNDGHFDRNYDPLGNSIIICSLSAVKTIVCPSPMSPHCCTKRSNICTHPECGTYHHWPTYSYHSTTYDHI